MTEKHSLSLQRIVDCLSANYGIPVSMLTLLPIGADMNASVYKAEACDGPSYFVKLKRSHRYDIGVTVLALLQASGIQQIIPPIKTTNDDLIQRIEGFTLTVYPFVEGKNGFWNHLTDDQWVTLGKVLRQVHEFDVPPPIKDRIRKENYLPKWRNAVQSLEAHIDEDLTGDEAALKLRAFMRKYKAVIYEDEREHHQPCAGG